MLNSCLEKYLIVYQFQNLVLKNTRSNYILLPRMGLPGLGKANQPQNSGEYTWSFTGWSQEETQSISSSFLISTPSQPRDLLAAFFDWTSLPCRDPPALTPSWPPCCCPSSNLQKKHRMTRPVSHGFPAAVPAPGSERPQEEPLLAVEASRTRKVSSTLLHWLMMSWGWRATDWSPAAGAQCNNTRSCRPAG